MKKNTIKIILITIVSLCVVVGGIIVARNTVNSNKTVGVDPVDNYANTWYTRGTSGYGQIKQGGTSEITLDNSLLLESVYVKEGDIVKKGDKLLKYDSTQIKVSIESMRIAYEIEKNNLKKAEDLLAYYKTFTAYTKPSVSVKSVLSSVSKIEDAISGDGSSNSPYTFEVGVNTSVNGNVLKGAGSVTLGSTDNKAKLNVYYTITGFSSSKIACVELTSNVSNFNIGDFISVDENGLVNISLNTFPYGTITKLKDDAFPVEEEIPYEKSLTDAEIKELIKSQEKTIATLKLNVAQAELDYRKIKASSDDGIIYSDVDGIVKSVADRKTLEDGKPFITITSVSGYVIETSISEYQLNDFKVGDTFEIMMWSTGNTYTATITEINNYPTFDNYYSYDYSNNASNYLVYASLDCDDELNEWDGGEITFDNKNSDALFALQACFVREENGQSYVLVKGENNRLEKRFIKTGDIVDSGYYIEIIEGLSLEDEIAFPYGKQAVVGAKCDSDMEVIVW